TGPGGGDQAVVPDRAAAERLPRNVWRDATAALREELRGVLLGYDADPERTEKLLALLEAELPGTLSPASGGDLAAIRAEVVLFADVEQLFVRAPRVSAGHEVEPSNSAWLRIYLRRMRGGGTGIPAGFLDLLRAALAHYDITELSHGDALERAMLRLFAAQQSPDPRRRLVIAMLRRLAALARAGVRLESDRALAS